ncbi:N-acetylmuramoyl-L-alanine amidase [Phosphitispora fastidiosa]|uniref:N-acetylmuramoyl-L-alanine amidase n=1 Tax=Phosphitispora fastidiosa TaxID=2837202 RepID=UPI001E2EA13B|nr:N-acetylmuramoyl-L-alanine amidase [Phosphitispora fastidiosa]MBU7008629.1 N-acetylmuramoyl-L-alanine amidase [Phosphitispora fastidiosa]
MTPKIVIDPGHGGHDPGAQGYGLQEKNINLDIAQKIRNKLVDYADVSLTRNGDVFVSLSDRAAFANREGADLFVSVHVNAGGGTGFESYIYPAASTASREITKVIHRAAADFYVSAGFLDRGFKEANFAVLRETDMPAILTENLFIDTREDAARLQDPLFRDKIAAATVNGIIRALQLAPPQPAPQQPEAPPHWAVEHFKRLREEGLVDSSHNLDAPITWGEFSAVISRLLDKLS